MHDRFWAALAAGCVLFAPWLARAQSSTLGSAPALAAGLASPTLAPAPAQAADFIVAVVNSEPITNSEVRREVEHALRQLAQDKQTAPARPDLVRQTLEELIGQKIQLQFAQELGLRATPAAIDRAEQNVALQNQLSLPALHQALAQDGITVSQFRQQLGKQLILAVLHEQEVSRRVQVSDLEADQYLLEQERNPDPAQLKINLAQILVAVPEGATPEQRAALQAKAQDLRAQLRAGADFATLARDASDAPERSQNGELGLRSADRYPVLFVAAARQLKVGDISEPLRSDAGWHIFKLLQKINANLPPETITQTHVRHILLRVDAQRTQSQALDELAELKRRLDAGAADFATLAREHSQDQAEQGGDLGWVEPGSLVAEFAAAMDRLEPGQLSGPVLSPFGVHLIKVEARRQVPLTPTQRRDRVRALLFEKKRQQAYDAWHKSLRQQTYVEMRAEPRW